MYDALIIGQGPAGLAAALGFCRINRTAAIFNSNEFRNAKARFSHSYLTRDHIPPSEIRRLAKEEITAEKYRGLIYFAETAAVKAQKVDNQYFEVEDTTGRIFRGRKLVLAVGVKDTMLPLPGYKELWGTHIFFCPFCDGYEEKGLPAGVLLTGMPAYAVMAFMLQTFTKNVTVFHDGETVPPSIMEGKFVESARAAGIKLETRKIKALSKDESVKHGLLVHLEDDTMVQLGYLMHKPAYTVNGDIHTQLGVEMTPANLIKTAEGMGFGETSVKGCFASGDCQTMMAQVALATTSGMTNAAGIAHQLALEAATTAAVV